MKTARRAPDRFLVGTVLAALTLGLLLYGPTVALPLFLDDASNFRWLTPTRGLDVWRTAGGFPFYRPLPFTLFKLLWHLQGGYHPPTLHALVVALHVINAILVGLLARRLTRRAWAGPVAAALLVAFPFSYQAVALVGSIFHLALVGGTVGAALLALRYLDTGSRWALVGAWMAAFLGIFSHENGVTVPLLVGIALLSESWHLGRSETRPYRQLAFILGPITALAALYVVAWLLVEKNNEASGVLWAALDAKIAYFAQGLVYPLSALARPFFEDAPVVVPVTLILAGLGVSAAFLTSLPSLRPSFERDSASRERAQSVRSGPSAPFPYLWGKRGNRGLPGWGFPHRWRKRRGGGLRAALLWVIVAAAPAALLLNSPYLLGGPRLLYLSSVGVALFWTTWLAGLAPHGAGRVFGNVTLAAFVLIGAIFAVRRVDDYRRLADFYGPFIEDAAQTPDQARLLVNTPAFIAPRKGAFLLGAEGATYLLDFISLQDLVWVNTGVEAQVNTVAFANTLIEDPDEVFSPRGPWVGWDELDAAIRETETVYSVGFADEDFHLARVGDRRHSPIDSPPTAAYDGITLYHARVEGEPPALTLEWGAPDPPPVTVFVHVLCGDQLATQFDGDPLGGLHPFARWEPGESWADHRALIGVPCGPADAILVGLYDPVTGERLIATLPDGTQTDAVAFPPGR